MADLFITPDNYFDKNIPSRTDQLYNSVLVNTQPIVADTSRSIVYSSNNITVPVSGLVYECIYNSIPAEDATASVTEGGANISISDATYYACNALLTLSNNDSVEHICKIEISGLKYTVQGEDTIISRDTKSITNYGIQEYSYPVNHLIQDTTMAQKIADTLVGSYKNIRKDIILSWRGNPALELRDTIAIKIYEKKDATAEFRVYKNQITFDGALKETTEGRLL